MEGVVIALLIFLAYGFVGATCGAVFLKTWDEGSHHGYAEASDRSMGCAIVTVFWPVAMWVLLAYRIRAKMNGKREKEGVRR